jgi:hypothetical protein
MSASEERWRGVEHDVHDTRLTGATVARVCSAHQGAGVTSAWFEANGDLKTASERDEDEDEDEDVDEGEAVEGRVGGASTASRVSDDVRTRTT